MSKSVKRVVKNSFFQTIGSFGISGLNFILILTYGRLLGPEGVGSLATSQAHVIVWTALVELGLSHSLIGALTAAQSERSELARQGFRARDLVFRVLFLRLLGAAIGFFAVYLFAVKQSRGDEALFWQDMAFTPFLFALAFQQTAVGFAAYRGRQGLAVFSQLAGMVFTVGLAIYLALRQAPISWLLLAQSWGGFFTAFVVFGYFFTIGRRKKRRGESRRLERVSKGTWGKEAWTALAQDAWPYAITFGVFVLWQRLDQIAVTHFLGDTNGGIYAMAVRVVSIPLLLATSISFALFPDLQRIGRDAPERVQLLLGIVTKVIWRYGIVAAAVILFLLGVLLRPLLPATFGRAFQVLIFFAPGVWAFWMQSFLVNALFGVRAYRLVVQAHLFALGFYIPSLYFLTQNFGLQGVIWSFNIFCLAMCFFGFRAARKAGLLHTGYLFYGAYTAEELEFWRETRAQKVKA